MNYESSMNHEELQDTTSQDIGLPSLVYFKERCEHVNINKQFSQPSVTPITFNKHFLDYDLFKINKVQSDNNMVTVRHISNY